MARLARWAATLAAAVALVAALLGSEPTPAAAAAARRRKSASAGAGAARAELADSFFERWAPFKELEKFMDALYKTYKPTKLISLSSIGKSAEKRKLTVMSIGTSSPKYQLMLMGTMHGREWITPYATLYTAWQLLKCHEEGEQRCVDLLASTQVHFLPVLNPDGYEFTRLPPSKNEQARQWRKNRRNLCSKCERGVHGIDLNRNWGVKDKSWGFGNDKATTEVYQGKHPFSEPEIKAVRDWLLHKGRAKQINAFFDVHCCSGAILPPFYYNGESELVQSRNLDNCKSIAKAMKSVNKIRYKWRPREKEFSASNTGIGADWIFAEAGIPNVFIVETRGNKTKLLKDIFEVPESEIIPIAKELEAGFWKMAELFANDKAAVLSAVTGAASGPTESLSSAEAAQLLAATDSLAEASGAAPGGDEADAVANIASALRGASSGEDEPDDEVAPGDMSLDDLLAAFDDPSIKPKAKPRPATQAAAPRPEAVIETLKPATVRETERPVRVTSTESGRDDPILDVADTDDDIPTLGDVDSTARDDDDDAFNLDDVDDAQDDGDEGTSDDDDDEEEDDDDEEEEDEDEDSSSDEGDDDEEADDFFKTGDEDRSAHDHDDEVRELKVGRAASASSRDEDESDRDLEALFAGLNSGREDDFDNDDEGNEDNAARGSGVHDNDDDDDGDARGSRQREYDEDPVDQGGQDEDEGDLDSPEFDIRIEQEAKALLGDDSEFDLDKGSDGLNVDDDDGDNDDDGGNGDGGLGTFGGLAKTLSKTKPSLPSLQGSSEEERRARLENYRKMRHDMDPKLREEIQAVRNAQPGRAVRLMGAGILILGVCGVAFIASQRRRNRFKGE